MTLPVDIHIHWYYLLTPIFMYAEIHYRIGRIFSRYFKREPEIVADAPSRLATGKKLPVFLCIKDAHRYPIELSSVIVTATAPTGTVILLDKDFAGLPVLDSLWTELYQFELPQNMLGDINVNVAVEYIVQGEHKTCVNDNYALTSHSPFNIFIDDHPRPCGEDWHFGDMHTHSHLTSDQVEFGAPFEITAAMARAMELDFFASADHSYDLDDRPDNYLLNDDRAPKWDLMWERIERLNSENAGFVILPGEELSAGNAKNQNVHYLIFNNDAFFRGGGDGAEQWPQTQPQHSIAEVLPQLRHGAVSFASHPEIKPPFLQRLLLRRGSWGRQDYSHKGLTGVQLWNGDTEHFLRKGLPRWIELLLSGRRLVLIAGTDAHGNFNRFRQIGLPHVSMREEEREIFGTAVTGVYIKNELTVASLVEALQRGRVIVTDGPFAAFTIQHSTGTARIGDEMSQTQGLIEIKALSSPSYGAIKKATLIIGDPAAKKETQRPLHIPSGSVNLLQKFFVEKLPRPGYIRLELETQSKQHYHCLTNPIFIA